MVQNLDQDTVYEFRVRGYNYRGTPSEDFSQTVAVRTLTSGTQAVLGADRSSSCSGAQLPQHYASMSRLKGQPVALVWRGDVEVSTDSKIGDVSGGVDDDAEGQRTTKFRVGNNSSSSSSSSSSGGSRGSRAPPLFQTCAAPPTEFQFRRCDADVVVGDQIWFAEFVQPLPWTRQVHHRAANSGLRVVAATVVGESFEHRPLGHGDDSVWAASSLTAAGLHAPYRCHRTGVDLTPSLRHSAGIHSCLLYTSPSPRDRG